MHDLRNLRDDPEAFDAAMARRGLDPQAEKLLALDREHRAIKTEMQELQARRNEASKAIGAAKGAGDEEKAEALMAEVGEIKQRLPELEERERALDAELTGTLASLPNILLDEVPDGADESANALLAETGEKPSFAFEPRQHDEIGGPFGLDFETAAAISGARFAVMRGQIALLHRALGQFMLDIQTREHGYTEVSPPLLVREEAMFGTGQLPKFADDSFSTTDGRWLIPTAEISLTNLVRERILAAEDLPIRVTALTPCFRSEAGAAGKDTRGMIRQHQFYKVELVSITTPEASRDEHERMTAHAETVLDRLDLAYRKVLLSAGDTGFGAAKTYDLEVWLPGQDCYREISSVSNCLDFQARRMNARYRPGAEQATRFVHTL
ncbi:MAG: serine--tRNA ligase, partial [Sphingomonadales bacterium]|nr:serine--tRNA ligase [Sphingomonadales bacterium]